MSNSPNTTGRRRAVRADSRKGAGKREVARRQRRIDKAICRRAGEDRRGRRLN